MEVLDTPEIIAPKNYATFWDRFGAVLIDGIILGVANFALIFAFGVSLDQNAEIDSAYIAVNILTFLLQLLYYAGMESSKGQATLGKKALGIKVTDLQGNRIGFGRAVGRYFGRVLSSLILLIGYLMQPFTAKKQALHDMLAGTLVLKSEQ